MMHEDKQSMRLGIYLTLLDMLSKIESHCCQVRLMLRYRAPYACQTDSRQAGLAWG